MNSSSPGGPASDDVGVLLLEHHLGTSATAATGAGECEDSGVQSRRGGRKDDGMLAPGESQGGGGQESSSRPSAAEHRDEEDGRGRRTIAVGMSSRRSRSRDGQPRAHTHTLAQREGADAGWCASGDGLLGEVAKGMGRSVSRVWGG